MEENGNGIAGNRTRHFNTKVFYIKDLMEQDIVQVKYCSTDNMVADYLSKLLVGAKFKIMRDLLMNLSNKELPSNSRSVGE